MKKLFILPILLIPLFLLVSCGEPPTVQSDFTASFTADHNGSVYRGTVAKEGGGLVVSLSEPYTVSGMEFCWEDSALSVRCQGHCTNANADYLPADSLPASLHNALAYLPQASYLSTENGEDRFTLPTPYGDAALTARSGIPTSLADPNGSTVFYFE
ncbi:MAG: hypothetical protein IJG87_00635 [Ruminococcus sp.]|nr:hypothetical protein [Ruminococcus sp.]